MGISHTKELGLDPDMDGNSKWILPHGIALHVEDFYQDPYQGRTINYVILSNKIDFDYLVKIDKELTRKEIC